MSVLIDCNDNPYIPQDGSSLAPHNEQIHSRVTGRIELDLAKVNLYLDPAQDRGKPPMEGRALRKALEGKQVLTAHALDWVLDHPEDTPEDWKCTRVYFWGTIYCDSVGNLCIRCFLWNNGRPKWSYCFLSSSGHFDWNEIAHAAILEVQSESSCE